MMETDKANEFIGPLILDQDAMLEFACRFRPEDKEIRTYMSNSHYKNDSKEIGTQTGRGHGETKTVKEKKEARKRGEE